MPVVQTHDLSIQFSPAAIHIMPAQPPVSFMDEIHMHDKSVWLVTRCDTEAIELLLKTRKEIPVFEISQFLEKAAYIKRADCWKIPLTKDGAV